MMRTEITKDDVFDMELSLPSMVRKWQYLQFLFKNISNGKPLNKPVYPHNSNLLKLSIMCMNLTPLSNNGTSDELLNQLRKSSNPGSQIKNAAFP